MNGTPSIIGITWAHNVDEDIKTDYMLLSKYESFREKLRDEYDLLLTTHEEYEKALMFYASRKSWDSGAVEKDKGMMAYDLLNKNL